MRPALRRVAPVVAALVVAVPLLRAPEDDSYPLSTYPMFAVDRGPVHEIATAVEIDADGGVRRLSPELIAGTDEVVLASVTVHRAIARGEADELCAEILDRVERRAAVVVRTETLDVVAHVTEGRAPAAIEDHARCERRS